MIDSVLALEGVVVRAAGRVILDVSAFTMTRGETMALLGPNGAGKTTLLHVAALLRRPDSGVVRIGDETASPQNSASLRRSLSVVFQDPLLFDVSALANAAAGLRFQGRARPEAEQRARQWLERFGVAQLADRRARTLSGGEAARVALARAFTTDPVLLLLDEPFAALDAPTRAALLPALRAELHEASAAALLVTHDLEEAFAFGDRIAVMREGHIAASGEPGSLLARPPTREVAELLGIETILAASVDRVAGRSVLLSLLAGGPPVCVRIPPGITFRPGQSVTLTLPAAATRALRPGQAVPDGWSTISGPVAAITTHPAGKRLVIASPASVVALAPWDPESRSWAIGEPAVVAFPADAAHVIPEP